MQLYEMMLDIGRGRLLRRLQRHSLLSFFARRVMGPRRRLVDHDLPRLSLRVSSARGARRSGTRSRRRGTTEKWHRNLA